MNEMNAVPHNAVMTEVARAMFAAYNATGPNPGKTWDGKDVPPWEDCGDQVRGKWTAAAHVGFQAWYSAKLEAIHRGVEALGLFPSPESQDKPPAPGAMLATETVWSNGGRASLWRTREELLFFVANAAMQADLIHQGLEGRDDLAHIAGMAYEMAEAMLAEGRRRGAASPGAEK